MIKFITELALKADTNGYKRIVNNEFIVEVGGEVFVMPIGFRTNLANTPKWIHWLLPPDDPHYIRAAIVHDFLYGRATVSRKQADTIFRKLAIHDGTSTGVAYLMYICLRLFGSSHYNPKRFK